MKKILSFWWVSVLILTDFCIFWEFFLKGLAPFPGSFLLAWFEPWKTAYTSGTTILIDHKAIASDIFRQLYPMKVLGMQMLVSGVMPLWNPYNGAGMPLLATMNIGFLDPLNIFFVLFQPGLAWSLTVVFQPLIIGVCTYLFARKLHMRPAPALLCSLVFILSGAVMVRFIYGIFGTAFASLPLLLYLIESFAQSSKVKRVWLIPFVILFCVVSTQPQISLYIFGLTFIYGLYRLPSWRQRGSIFILYLLGVGLAGVQLVPTAELFLLANVNQGSSAFIFDRFLMPLSHYVTVIIPNFYGSDSTYNFWEKTDYIETVAFVGTIPVFLSLIGLLKQPVSKMQDQRLFWGLVLVICFLTTWNTPVTHLLFSLPLPLLSTGIPTRIFLLSSLAFAILAGYGSMYLLDHASFGSVKKLIASYSGFLVALFLVVSFLYVRHIHCPTGTILTCRSVTFRNVILESGIFLLFVISLLLYFWKGKKCGNIFIGVTIFLIFAIGVYNAQKFLPFSDKSTYLPSNTILQRITHDTTDESRVFGFNTASIATDFATDLHYYDPNYYHPLYIRRYGELIAYANSDSRYTDPLQRSDVQINPNATVSAEITRRRERLFNLLSVSTLLFKQTDLPLQQGQQALWQLNGWYALSNPTALPRASMVFDPIIRSDPRQILSTLFAPTFDPQRQVVLEKNPRQIAATGSATARIISLKENEVRISVATTQKGLLVLTDNDYPGWKAFVDGRETPIFRANYTFRAVVVPEGVHVVKFVYQPVSVVVGIWISIVSLIIIGILFLRKRFA